jgi:Carboxypeptidase regulatory-like domain
MKTIAFCLFVLISTVSAWAGGALQGTVKDSRGNPIRGAEIRVQPTNANVAKATKSDASGHYFCDNLAIGTDYRVTLTINGMVKASLLNVRAGAEKPTELSFYLQPANRFSDKHMVWIPDQPAGTHIGAGHWAEVDEHGRIVERADTDIVVMGRDYARQLQLSGAKPML